MKTKAFILSATAIVAFCVSCAPGQRGRQAVQESVPTQAAQAHQQNEDVRLSDAQMNMIADSDEEEQIYLLDFYADWCGPCRQLKPYMEKWEDRYDGVIDFEEINVDEHPDIAAGFGVESIPTVIIVDRSGRVLGHVVGFQPDSIESALNSVAAKLPK